MSQSPPSVSPIRRHAGKHAGAADTQAGTQEFESAGTLDSQLPEHDVLSITGVRDEEMHQHARRNDCSQSPQKRGGFASAHRIWPMALFHEQDNTKVADRIHRISQTEHDTRSSFNGIDGGSPSLSFPAGQRTATASATPRWQEHASQHQSVETIPDTQLDDAASNQDEEHLPLSADLSTTSSMQLEDGCSGAPLDVSQASSSSVKSNCMTVSRSYQIVADTTGLRAREVKAVVEAVMDVAAEELKSNGCFKLGDMLTIRLKSKPACEARKGVHPVTKEPCMLKAKPASKTVRVRVLKKLKNSL